MSRDPPVYLSMRGCLCVHLSHFEYTKQPHLMFHIGCFVLTNTKRTFAKCGLKTLHIFFVLLGYSPYVHYVDTVLFTVPLRPIYVNGLCHDWLTYLNVSYGVVHQGGLNS